MSTRVFNCTSQKHCLNKENIVTANDVNLAVQRSNLFWRILPRTAPRRVQIMKSLHLNFKQILFCIMPLLGLSI